MFVTFEKKPDNLIFKSLKLNTEIFAEGGDWYYMRSVLTFKKGLSTPPPPSPHFHPRYAQDLSRSTALWRLSMVVCGVRGRNESPPQSPLPPEETSILPLYERTIKQDRITLEKSMLCKSSKRPDDYL